ncbi:hypothetical protein PMAYCL1PPCAC_00073 [Pristionchus mayeri]|uniref:Uncharacterized protein n=1 Tax=Pristionchus mayeri TaxID=1317129 RepID=A0AAN4Z0U6_9BILA|nr:hypothetical protein PMAYCL1PPCAC_00073 [Pristionchus mayeri]
MSPSVLDDENGQQATAGRKTGAIDGVGPSTGAGGGAGSAAAAAARPSNVKRARPLSQSTPPPEAVPVEKKKAYEPKDVDHLGAVLATFAPPDMSEEGAAERTGEAIAPHHQEEVEDLFKLIARVGNPLLPWETIRPVFLWKLRHVMEESVRVERLADERIQAERRALRATRGTSTPPPAHQVKGGVEYRPPAEGWEDERSELRDSYRFILGRAASLTAAPFTFQRICELLVDPLRHYKKAETLFRALEKCINVVTCVDESGARITGVEPEEEEEPMDEANGRVEQHFFGKIDELDDAMEQDGEDQEPALPNSAAERGWKEWRKKYNAARVAEAAARAAGDSVAAAAEVKPKPYRSTSMLADE